MSIVTAKNEMLRIKFALRAAIRKQLVMFVLNVSEENIDECCTKYKHFLDNRSDYHSHGFVMVDDDISDDWTQRVAAINQQIISNKVGNG